jgi:hypothetical protein
MTTKNLAQLTDGAPLESADLLHFRRESGTPTDHKITALELTAKLPTPSLAAKTTTTVFDLLMLSDADDGGTQKKLSTLTLIKCSPVGALDAMDAPTPDDLMPMWPSILGDGIGRKQDRRQFTAALPVDGLSPLATPAPPDELMVADSADAYTVKKTTMLQLAAHMPTPSLAAMTAFFTSNTDAIAVYQSTGAANKFISRLGLATRTPISELSVASTAGITWKDAPMMVMPDPTPGEAVQQVTVLNLTARLPIPSLTNMGDKKADSNYRDWFVAIYNATSDQYEMQSTENMLRSAPWYHQAAQATPGDGDLFMFNDTGDNTKKVLTFAQLKAAILAP